jgi:hypothetical protein
MNFIPTNTYMDLMVYLSSNEKPLSRSEMDKFWNSCSLTEKHQFMCADLSDLRTEGNVELDTWLRDFTSRNKFVPENGGSHSLMGISETYPIVDEWQEFPGNSETA